MVFRNVLTRFCTTKTLPHKICHLNQLLSVLGAKAECFPLQTRESSNASLDQTFGIAFDIDGVLLHGKVPIPGAHKALKKLCNNNIPHIYLTNGGGVTEEAKAKELSSLLGVPVSSSQVVLGHTAFKNLVDTHRKETVLAVGRKKACHVLKHYGFEHAISIEDYVHHFPHIDPLDVHKPWLDKQSLAEAPSRSVHDFPVKSVFVVCDPVDWSRDLQVLCDVLRSGGQPGRLSGPQPKLYFAADDFQYQSNFTVPRLGMGAFRVALQAIYERLTGRELEYEYVGKPQSTAFSMAEEALCRTLERMHGLETSSSQRFKDGFPFSQLYMVGDNPFTDIKGANLAGGHWRSILTRTGIHKGQDNHLVYPAYKVVDNAHEAVDFILRVHIE